ncbi:MAG TPA: methyltransferase domain-containing protein [Terriglobales bacterium]|nr:methyltransferase domain-containing protein [Terriglobales bacterium]
MKRVPTIELLDSDAGSQQEISGSLADLWFINRAFGGVSSACALIEQIASKASLSKISLLDVASGPGQVPNEVKRKLQRSGIDLEISLLDRSRSHMNGSRKAVVGDASALPFQDESFDVVSSNLFVHHLMPEAMREFMSEALRVCRTAVVINDVIRNPLHLALVYAGLPLFRSRLTWHDAPASVRQAYTPEEMRGLLSDTPAARVDFSRHYLFRMGVIAWKTTL